MILHSKKSAADSSKSLTAARLTSASVTLCLIAIFAHVPLQAQSRIPPNTLLPAAADLQIAAPDVDAPPGPLPSTYNPFDDSQLEQLALQGQQHQEAGNHALAVEFLDRAWQSSRVSLGLYHSAQIPILERMIVSQIELENWQAIDAYYSYLELIYTRLYEVDDIKLEEGLQKVSSWHINAFNLNLDGKQEQHLRKAREILKLRLEIANNTLPPDHPRFEFLHESIRLSETHLYLLSERYKEQLRKQKRAERERLLATLD